MNDQKTHLCPCSPLKVISKSENRLRITIFQLGWLQYSQKIYQLPPPPSHAVRPQNSILSFTDQHQLQHQGSTNLHIICISLQIFENAWFSKNLLGSNELKKSSPLKLLYQFQPNLGWMSFRISSINFIFYFLVCQDLYSSYG